MTNRLSEASLFDGDFGPEEASSAAADNRVKEITDALEQIEDLLAVYRVANLTRVVDGEGCYEAELEALYERRAVLTYERRAAEIAAEKGGR